MDAFNSQITDELNQALDRLGMNRCDTYDVEAAMPVDDEQAFRTNPDMRAAYIGSIASMIQRQARLNALADVVLDFKRDSARNVYVLHARADLTRVIEGKAPAATRTIKGIPDVVWDALKEQATERGLPMGTMLSMIVGEYIAKGGH